MPRQTFPVRHSTERGNVLILTAVTLFVMIGMMALAIDVGHLLNGKAQLQSALDAAALAAAAEARVVIKDPRSAPTGSFEEIRLVTKYGTEFGNLNLAEMSRSVSRQTSLTLQSSNFSLVDLSNNLPSITVSHQVPLTTFFAGILGFSEVNISASSRAAAVAVDGGIGLISGGLVGAGCEGTNGNIVTGCWRPILLPDFYYDPVKDGGTVTHLSQNIDFNTGLFKPLPEGAYYVSRFASNNPPSPRSGFPFVDTCVGNCLSPGGPPTLSSQLPEITSLRDAAFSAQKINNFMGSQVRIEIASRTNALRYRIVDFDSTYNRKTTWSGPELHAFYGYCGQVQIGDRVKVFGPTEWQTTLISLQNLRREGLHPEIVPDDGTDGTLYKHGYIKTQKSPCRFETPNTHPLIIPVLFCNPFDFYRNQDSREFIVTNFGAFYITSVDANGGLLQGWFIREVIAGGTPLDPANKVAFPHLLPVSIRLAQ